MAKIWVRLRDHGSIWHNVGTDETVTGKRAMEITKSDRVAKALKGGAIVELTEAEAAAFNDEHQVPSLEALAIRKEATATAKKANADKLKAEAEAKAKIEKEATDKVFVDAMENAKDALKVKAWDEAAEYAKAALAIKPEDEEAVTLLITINKKGKK